MAKKDRRFKGRLVKEDRLQMVAAANRKLTRAARCLSTQSIRRPSITVLSAATGEAIRESIWVMGRSGRVVLNSGEEVPVRYVVAEADELITSHREGLYEPDARYPSAAQPRDYRGEKELQLGVEARANRLDAGQLLTDSVLPIDGPPIIREDGVVISGNGRTQSMKLAIARGLYGGVRCNLMERASQYGLDAEQIKGMVAPVLVRLMDKRIFASADLARYGIEMNRDPAHGLSAGEQSMAFSRLLTFDIVERLAFIAEQMPDGFTVREFMRKRATDVKGILNDSGMIDPRKRAEYFTDDGGLTEAAKELIENTLAGLTVTDPDVIRRASRSVRDRLARVGIHFARMRAAGEMWNLVGYNDEAVTLLADAEDRASYLRSLKGRKETGDERHGSESLVERLLHPERFTRANLELGLDLQGRRARIHPVVEALAMAMEQRPREFVDILGRYAFGASQGGETMFGIIHPAEVFTDTVGICKDGDGNVLWRLPVRPDQWHGASETVGAGREMLAEGRLTAI